MPDNNKVEWKSFPLILDEWRERKDKNDPTFDPRTIPALFSVTGVRDAANDVIHRGAFKKTLKERADRIKVLWQHDMREMPIGVPVSIKEVGREDLPQTIIKRWPEATGGLFAEVRYLDTPRGNEALTGIHEGAITENSIGFDASKVDFEEIKSPDIKYPIIQRNIREARLWDISPVNWGMNEASRVTLNMKDASAEEITQALQTATCNAINLANALQGAASEVKAGQVLSAANLGKLKAALATLQEILLAAEPQDDNDAKLLALKAKGLLTRLAFAERSLSMRGESNG